MLGEFLLMMNFMQIDEGKIKLWPTKVGSYFETQCS